MISRPHNLPVFRDELKANPTERHRGFLVHAAGVFLLSTIVILSFWAVLPASYRQNDSTDYTHYYEPVARNVLRGSGIVQRDGLIAISNPPGYSILLAGVFGLAEAAHLPEALMYPIFVLCCMGLSAVCIFLISRSVWGIRGAWLSVLFFTTYPFSLWLTKQPSSEVPFMLFFYASLLLFWMGMRYRNRAALSLFLSGLLMGIAMLIRGIAVGSGLILFALFLFIQRSTPAWHRIALAGMILLGNLVALLPWQVWVYRQTSHVVLLGTNAAPSIRDGLTFAVNNKGYRKSTVLAQDVIALQNQFLEESSSMNSASEVLGRVYIHFLKRPQAVTELILVKIMRSWYGTDSGSLETGIGAIQWVYACIVLGATMLLMKRRDQYSVLLIVVWTFVFYFWGMTTAVLSILRYMAPTIGLLALLVPVFLRLPKSAFLRLRSS